MGLYCSSFMVDLFITAVAPVIYITAGVTIIKPTQTRLVFTFHVFLKTAEAATSKLTNITPKGITIEPLMFNKGCLIFQDIIRSSTRLLIINMHGFFCHQIQEFS